MTTLESLATAVPEAAALSTTLPRPRYSVSLARNAADVRAAQRLRHQVFAGEMGALLDSPEPGLDIDPFDAHCDHLIVREDATGTVVGTYRLLPPERAAAAGRLYAESEFDLTRHAGIRGDLVEVGRSCVHPDHRDGAVIGLMWAGTARYLVRTGHNWLAGCCSVPLADGGTSAAGVWDTVGARHLSPEEYRVRPHRAWDPAGLERPRPGGRNALPPLLRGYLRLGAWVCGEPAHDPDFGVADFYVLLSLRRTDPRYLRHFLSLAPAQ
ncbi:GNAT family N-acyltransferase [Streptomyces sp. H10-C2]|uniref:GNAT family N-acetyltransferase n=1 Tax=unclassified Streptomyces TaxID=2593676 RepID=UPI0024BB6351|nr:MULTISPECIES: GNAT family N-acyltransferase [unclassified Streptomyces]MDJ0346715.1 GNAT family N-acyltransferase [Streptomyces sp. PH10-H1]MDJ0375167.1 GNAT family N-acyltransferase [Streptomyces sp. H10-C2]